MSGELEAAGAAATAGLIGKAIEGRTGVRHGEGRCLNCGADVNGRYCADCGQPTHVARTLGHLVEEFVHGLLHFDTKAWRTLPMLVGRPGTLTYNYIHGMRARYISPLAMFLFTVFLMFFVFSLVAPYNNVRIGGEEVLTGLTDAQLQQKLQETRTNEEKLRQAAARFRAEHIPGEEGMEEGADAMKEARGLIEEEIERRAKGETVVRGRPCADSLGVPCAPTSAAERRASGIVNIDGAGDLNAKIQEKLENPELLFYKIQQNAYKFSFLLVPISLPFVALLFLWKRGWTLYDHVVFTLYSLSFMSLLFVAVALLTMGGDTVDSLIALLVSLGVPAHMFFQLKGAYRLSIWSALWRTFFLLIFASICLVIFIVLMFLFGVLG